MAHSCAARGLVGGTGFMLAPPTASPPSAASWQCQVRTCAVLLVLICCNCVLNAAVTMRL